MIDYELAEMLFFGVRLISLNGIDRWEAYVTPDGYFKSLGYFGTAIQAAHAHDYDAAIIYGRGARLNFPRQEKKT